MMAAILSASYYSYSMGVDHQKVIYAKAQQQANDKVIEKTLDTQNIANEQAKIQIIYKDRIITKYQTITKEIIKYENTTASDVGLDSEFVRLHNSAASANDAVPIAQSASGANSEPTGSGVTTGEAIGVITRNYESYQNCKRQVEGWNKFYTDLQNTINK